MNNDKNLSNLNKEYKIINSLINLGFTSIVFFFIFGCIILIPSKLNFIWDHLINFGTPSTYVYISLGFLFIFVLLNTIASILILSSNWSNNWPKENKLLWGLLSLLVLFSVGILIFTYRARKEFLNSSNINKLTLAKQQFNKLNSLIVLSFFTLLMLIGFVVAYLLTFKYLGDDDFNNYNVSNILWLILLASFWVLNIIGSVAIIGNDWTNEWSNKNKLLWGLLSLLLLAFVSSLIFCIISTNKYAKDYPNIYESSYSKNYSILYKKYNKDHSASITLIVLCALSTLFFLTFIVSLSIVISTGLVETAAVLAAMFGSLWQGINISLSIVILGYKWENNWAKRNKLLFGLLSLVLIYFIGIFVFSGIVLKQTKQSLKSEKFSEFKLKTKLNEIFNKEETESIGEYK